MSARVTANRRARRSTELARPPFECIALLLQGGGALGAYQGGVYDALAGSEQAPTWVAGISIGAVNAALIAGNPPTARVERLREFWKLITAGGPWDGIARFAMPPSSVRSEFARGLLNQLSAGAALLGGAAGFFAPRVPTLAGHRASRPQATTIRRRSGPHSNAWSTSIASMPARRASASAP